MPLPLNPGRHAVATRPRAGAVRALLVALALLVAAPAALAQRGLNPVPGVTSFEQQFSVGTSAIRRVLYLRPVAAPTGRVPVMVVLHYGGGSPEAMANLIRLGELVRDTGAWAILPEASGRAWNHDPRRDRPRSEDDVELITRVIDNAAGSLPIDPRRVYLSGFSSGGFMAQRYACERPERITAMAYVSATLLDSLAAQCTSAAGLPVIGMHGTADARVSYGDRVGLASAPDTARFNARRNGCLGLPQRSRLPDRVNDGTTVDLDLWDSCASGQPVRFYTINRGGHTWPGNDVQVGLRGVTTRDIDATRLIWELFSPHSR